MRAGPLSNPRVVALLNRYFVPVYIDNADYGKNGTASAAEKAERKRILAACEKAKLSAGSVQVFILTEGQPFASLHVADAAKVERFMPLLERTIATLKPRPGPSLVPPVPQAAPPRCDADALALHVITRYLHRKGNRVVVDRADARLGRTDNASWTALPGENWVVLQRDEWQRLLAWDRREGGGAWLLDRAVAARILTHFYPPTDNNQVATNRIRGLAVQARVMSVGDVVRIRLDGQLRMEHAFNHPGERGLIEAPLLGYLDYDVRRQQITALQLVTDGATYNGGPFGALVRLEH
jgi:hypothetical protein